MKFDVETGTLRFSSPEEATAFHDEMTQLVRTAVAGAHLGVRSTEEATQRSREAMKTFHTVLRALNAIRDGLPG